MPVADKGWVHLHRSIQDSDIWNCDEPFCYRSAWIDLILLANHKHGSAFGKIPVSRGQLVTSLRKLKARWHWHYRKLTRYLDILQAEKMIIMDTNSNYTIITIINYDKYQVFPDGNTNGNTSGNASGTPSGNANGTQTRMIKNDIKNDKEIKASPSSYRGWGNGES